MILFFLGFSTCSIVVSLWYLFFIRPLLTKNEDTWVIFCDWDVKIKAFEYGKKHNISVVEYRDRGFKNNNREKQSLTIHYIEPENQLKKLLK